MELEFDPAKSERNIRERGLPFELAAGVLSDIVADYVDARHDYGEERRVAFGRVAGRLLCVVYVRRGDAFRIISLRKANSKEIARWAGSEA